MFLEKIYIQGFRSYQSRLFSFDDRVTVVYGKNATGKTNLLEVIYLLATGESFRAQKIDEMVSWGSEVAHVGCSFEKNREKTELKVVLTRGIVEGERARKRQYLVNGVSRQKQNFVGNFWAVAFLPTDLQLISGSPQRRRKYLDAVLCQVDKEYYRSLLSYEKALRRRNKMLDLIRDGRVQRSALLFWDQLLIKEGMVITNKRQQYIYFLNDLADDRRIVYDFSLISEKRLLQYAQEEILVGYTMVGPHKDDFSIEKKTKTGYKDLGSYGSRGEQRMGVLGLKIGEIEYIHHVSGERPVLLLDDIFSELDAEHESIVWNMTKKQQTIITTADESELNVAESSMILME